MLKFPSIILVLGYLLAQGFAFVTHPAFAVVSANPFEPGLFSPGLIAPCVPHTLMLQSTRLYGASISTEHFYNLEELEDKETCTTEIFLKSDKSLQVGKTDGPLYLNAAGSWSQETDGTFRMTLKRWYNAGKEPASKTDMGEFQFEVERLFVGEVITVGGIAAVSGSMHHLDGEVDRQVGFFNLIDTSDERKKN